MSNNTLYSVDGKSQRDSFGCGRRLTACHTKHFGIKSIDGSNFKRLMPADRVNADPHWSKDGSKIIFYSERDGNDEIYIVNADGS